MGYSIAIDGPAGAGKSSVADRVAEALGILHLDTGAMYRAFAYRALKEGISPDDEKALTELTGKILPEVRFENGRQITLIGGEDVSELIRTEEVSHAASASSRFAGVRAAMVKRQQEMAKKQDMILDGRDIGTVVLPDATLKVYLTADAKVRAKRRYDEIVARGEEADFDTILSDIIARDEQDTKREVTPLRQAEDAILVDSSYQSIEQVVAYILRLLRFKRKQKQIPVEKLNFMGHFCRGLLTFLFHTFFPVAYVHKERALLSAPYILIANHLVFSDPFVVSHPVSYLYLVRFLGKKELVKSKIGKWLLQDQLKLIPVERNETDMTAMRACLKTLKEGHVLGIFPEGTRHKEGIMENIDSGTSMMAMRTGSILLPCYIDRPLGFFRKAHVYYGKPFSLNDLAEGGVTSTVCEEANQRIVEYYRSFVEHPEA